MAIITINPDKTINIDGKKTFPVGMWSICAPYVPLTDCIKNVNINNNSMISNLTGNAAYRTDIVIPGYNSKNILFTQEAWTWVQADPNIIKNNIGFFGYNQWNEPVAGSDRYANMTDAEMLADLLRIYNLKKSDDPSHPVFLDHWEKMTKWLPYGDIMTWDCYTISNHSWQDWVREDAIYAWEYMSWQNYFQGTELNKVSKPVWTYIQANINAPSYGTLEPTKPEIRANTYTAITLDVKGILFWGYLVGGDWTNTSTVVGIYSNPTLAAYYNEIASEIRSLNDILVLPTLDYSWHYHPGTKVSFSKKFTKTLHGLNMTNFNYILKQNGNTWYLIVVNKDTRPISDVGITIAGLSGSMTATTLGNIDAGSIPGRTLPVTDGQFIDSFDGLAVHIYEIGSDIPCPPPQCDFTITQ